MRVAVAASARRGGAQAPFVLWVMCSWALVRAARRGARTWPRGFGRRSCSCVCVPGAHSAACGDLRPWSCVRVRCGVRACAGAFSFRWPPLAGGAAWAMVVVASLLGLACVACVDRCVCRGADAHAHNVTPRACASERSHLSPSCSLQSVVWPRLVLWRGLGSGVWCAGDPAAVLTGGASSVRARACMLACTRDDACVARRT